MTTEVGCGEAVWMTGQRRWGQWGGGSGPPLDGSRVQAALGDSQCLAPPLTLSFAAGCAQSEVHRLFRVSVSGFPHHLESVINTACFTLWTRLL